MKLYHGSNIAIEKIDLSKGRPAKDFGRGFYLSDDKRQASCAALSLALFLTLKVILLERPVTEKIISSDVPVYPRWAISHSHEIPWYLERISA